MKKCEKIINNLHDIYEVFCGVQEIDDEYCWTEVTSARCELEELAKIELSSLKGYIRWLHQRAKTPEAMEDIAYLEQEYSTWYECMGSEMYFKSPIEIGYENSSIRIHYPDGWTPEMFEDRYTFHKRGLYNS